MSYTYKQLNNWNLCNLNQLIPILCPPGILNQLPLTQPAYHQLVSLPPFEGLIILISFSYPGCLASKSEERLFRKLFSRYNQYIRPVENVSNPVKVHFEVAITQLANVVCLHNLTFQSLTKRPFI